MDDYVIFEKNLNWLFIRHLNRPFAIKSVLLPLPSYNFAGLFICHFSFALSDIIDPCACIHISLPACEGAFTKSDIVLPLSLIFRAVAPLAGAFSLS